MPPPSYTKDQLAAASKFLEILENIKRAQKDNVALTQEQTDVLSQNNIAAADVNKALNTQKEELRKIKSLRREESAHLLEQIDLLNTQKSILETHQQSFQDIVDLADTNKDLAEAQIAYLEEQNKLHGGNQAQYLAQLKIAKQDLKVADEKADTLRKQAGAGERVGAAIAGVLGISRDTTPSFSQNLVLMMKQEGSAKAIAKEFGGVNGVLSSIGNKGMEIFTGLFMMAIKLATATYDLGVNLRRTTGMTAAMAAESQALNISYQNLAYSSDQLQQATTALFMSVSEFTMATPATRARMTELAMSANRAGVSFEDLAKATQIGNRVLGQAGASATESALELGKFAHNIGLAPSTIVQAYGTVVPSIAAMGKGVGKEMRELMRINKATGIEMQRLIAIGDQFDTFEGSAKAVGSLNAMLGGDFVNAIDLMMAKSPSERFMQIKDALDAAGKSFDTMTYYERKAIAGALGFSNVGELAMMMKGNFDALNETAQYGTADWEKYYEGQKNLKTMKEELTATMARMAPELESLIKHFTTFVEYIQKPETITMGKQLIKLMGAMKVASWGLAAAQTAAALSMKRTALFIGGLALAAGLLAYVLFEKAYASNFLQGLGKFALAIFGLGRASDASSPSITRMVGPLLAMGGAVLLAGIGVKMAADAVAGLVTSFNGLGAAAGPAADAVGYLMGGFVAFMVVLAVLAVAAAPVAPVMLAIGAAVALVGAGIGLAAAGMSLFVNALATMFDKVDPATLALSMGAMASVLPILALAASTAIIPIGGLAGAFAALALSITGLTFSLGKLKALEAFPNLQAAIVSRVMAVTVAAGESTGRAVASAIPTPGVAAAGGGTGPITVQLDRQGTIDFLGGKPVTKQGLADRLLGGR